MINHHFKAEHNAIVLLRALQRNPEMSTEGANLLITMRGRSRGEGLVSDGSGSSGAVARRIEFKGRNTIEEISSKRKFRR